MSLFTFFWIGQVEEMETREKVKEVLFNDVRLYDQI